MKTLFIPLLTFSCINFSVHASHTEQAQSKTNINGYSALKSLSADQQNVLLYLCWKPAIKKVETAINASKTVILETKTDKQATKVGLSINNEPLYISMGKIDARRQTVTLCLGTIAHGTTGQYGAKFSTITCTFDQFKANVIKGESLFTQHGYEVFAGSCMTHV